MTKAFCPGNVSCIFRIVNGNTKKRHSLGVGFTVDKGAEASVKLSKKSSVYLNGKRIKFPTVGSVVKKLTDKDIEVRIKADLPLSAGFGMSGACALGTAYALGKLLRLKKTKKQLAMAAHEAEVENSTGLGDVGGQYNGGFNVKFRKGKPLEGTRLSISNKTIYYRFFSKIETKKVIDNKKKKTKINKAGDRALKKVKKIIKNARLADIIGISKEFSVESGLLSDKKVRKVIADIEKRGGNASMIMLGNAVFSDIPFKGSKKILIIKKGAYVI